MLRKMVRNGFHRKEDQWSFKMTNEHLLQICRTENVDIFVRRLKRRYIVHVIRGEDEGVAKQASLAMITEKISGTVSDGSRNLHG